MEQKIRIGTRGSKLALWQAHHVAQLIKKHWPDLSPTVVPIKTTGDLVLDVSLNKMGGKGLFIKEIENALINDQVDIAVHSMKDMPGEAPKELAMIALLPREDARDVVIANDGLLFHQLPAGARVGTSSLRRICQLKKIRPDLDYIDLRGNVDTRLSKLKKGLYDAIILAAAGLKRLGGATEITEYLNLIPAVGQGAIGIEARKKDQKIAEIIKPLNDEWTYRSVMAERQFLNKMQGNCHVPLGCLVTSRENQTAEIKAFISDLEAKEFIFRSKITHLNNLEEEVEAITNDILAHGGKEIVEKLCADLPSKC